MRRFSTLTLLTGLRLPAANSPSAQQREATPVRQETRAVKPGSPAADADFAPACREASKLTAKLAEDRKFADRLVEAARAQDRAKTEALLKEAGVRGELKVDLGRETAGGQARAITITICIEKYCVTIIIHKNSAA